MDYKNTLDYLLNIPMFQSIGASAYNPSLDKITMLCEELDSPHLQLKTIHIAGTNGKGSTSNLIASVLEAKGLKTALYTSPHLIDFRERMTINGEMIPEKEVVSFVCENRETINRLSPSFFEVTTAMAFWWFTKCKVDIAVIECGLGGKFDATNIITPIVSIITNISKDHTAILGDTLSKIAIEKSGIIKPTIPVVVGEWDLETSLEIISVAKQKQSESFIASQRYTLIDNNIVDGVQKIRYNLLTDGNIVEISTNLLGAYQCKNVATALTALDVLDEYAKDINIDIKDIEKGFLACRLKGRYQQIGSNPRIICDTGHNEAGISSVARQLSQEKYNKLWIIIGMVADKDVDSILTLLPKDANYVFTKPSVARALSVEELSSKAALQGINGESFQSVEAALNHVKQNASAEDLIYVGGSTFVVADLIKL
ncbi:MAG: folylpolyglutamate synthase/dihydrofolate synthase family protein [Rikenellaceae bacterium]